MTRTRAVRLLPVLLAAVTAGACGSADPPPVPPARTAVASSPPPSCPLPAREPVTGSGGQLRTAILGFQGPYGSGNYALPEQLLAAVPDAFDRRRPNDELFALGMFTRGGGLLSFTVTNAGAQAATVYDVRPVNIVRECTPLGMAVELGSEGGEGPSFRFDLDAAAPRAFEVDPQGRHTWFFEKRTITLEPGRKESVSVQFDTLFGAYSFDLAIAFEAGGAKYTQLLRNDAGPFRVASSLCPTPADRQQLTADQVAQLKKLRYRQVRVRRADKGVFSIVAITPEQYAARCQTL
ncbi:hypothetical protein [Catellatospora vulcania]|uniref:hypothetical protein n=1 Tax=Catellatospora vulcania TaxID=1460450 RepID=UPI0012D4C459|nr:hypothetical protein [Catellatospora vulcania]